MSDHDNQNDSEYTGEETNTLWIHASKDVTIFGIDYRVLFFSVLFFVHMRYWTAILFASVFAFFYLLKMYDLNVAESMKKFRFVLANTITSNKKRI